jgi:hypothetical protein
MVVRVFSTRMVPADMGYPERVMEDSASVALDRFRMDRAIDALGNWNAYICVWNIHMSILVENE